MASRRQSGNGIDTLGIYLREIGRFPVLTKAEEVELARRVAEGDTLARQAFINSNLRLVVWHAKRRHHAGSTSMMDLIQEGNCGLLRAVDLFDWRKGFKFSTYATWWIQQKMQRSYWQKSQTIRLPRIMQLRVETLGRVTEDLLTKSRRPPTLEELSEYSNLSIAQVKEVMGFTYDVLSLDVAFSEDDKGKVLGELIPIDDFDLELVDDKLGYSYASERLVEIIYEVLDQITADIIIQRFGLVRTPSQSVDAIEKHFDYSTHEIARRARQGLQVLLLTKEAELEALRDLVTLDLRSVAAEDLSLEPNESYHPAAGQPIANARQISWVNELRDFLIAQGGIFENQLGRGFNMDLGQRLGWSKRRVSQVVKIMREAGLITAYTKTTSPSSHVYKIELAQASATEPA